jgi:hypothetical protein
MLAALVAERLGAALVPADDFFSAQFTDADWDARTPSGRAADALDWRRLRAEAMEPLLASRSERWYPFDFSGGAPAWTGRMASAPKRRSASQNA